MKTGMLVKQGADGRSRPWPLLKSRILVGRAMQHDIVLADASVSRDHAVIDIRPGAWVLTDCDSRNGTRVDGTEVRDLVELPAGARLELGDVELRVAGERIVPSMDLPERTRVDTSVRLPQGTWVPVKGPLAMTTTF